MEAGNPKLWREMGGKKYDLNQLSGNLDILHINGVFYLTSLSLNLRTVTHHYPRVVLDSSSKEAIS